MNTLDHIVIKIIKEQEFVIGPLAWSEAGKVQGLRIINKETEEIMIIEGNHKQVVDRLVAQYERLFGRASQEVCKDAVKNIIAEMPRSDVPESLLA